MSNIKISQLPQAGALTGTELIPLVQSNITSRTTLQQIKSFAAIPISNNIIGDANSTTKAPSVNAIKTYADGLVVGLLNDRGNYTPSVTSPGAYPSSGGSGTGGAIEKGDIWFIDGVGYLGTTAVTIGSSVRALVNNPSPTTDSDWDILDASLIQATLQSVLNNGNTALNQSIELDSATGYSYLDSNSLYVEENNDQGYFSSIDTYVYNDATGNYIESYVGGANPLLTIYKDSNGHSINITDSNVTYYNGTFNGVIGFPSLTNNQAWTFPDASGTLALANNVWNATGNAGTVAGANFLGTTDAIDFVAKTNNTERLRILSTGQIKLNSLTGTGTRMVVANASGQLGTQTITSPTLQTVTDAGNITTNDMSVITPFDTSSVNVENTTDSSKATLIQELNDGGRIELTTATGNTLVLKCNLLTAFRTIQFPDTNGTVALLSDINPGNTWNVVGNAGTTAGTNFIGTTDSIDFVTKTNNVERLRVLESGELIILDLAGSGTRMVVADSTGQLSTQAITSPTLQVVTSGTNKNLIDGINLQGTGAGDAQSGTNVNAFGVDAAKNNTGNFVNAIGYNAAKFNTSNYVNAFGYGAGEGNQGANINAFGYGAGYTQIGNVVNAFGVNTATSNSGSHVNAFGGNAASSNSGNDINASGYFSAYNNTGTFINAIGRNASYNNSGDNVNALGLEAAQNNSGTYVNALGYQAAKGNAGGYVNAMGSGALENNTGSDVNAFGNGAGSGNQINGATIFSNASMPSYADYAAASAAITTGAGGTAGCTYLYHDQATNSIGAVRL